MIARIALLGPAPGGLRRPGGHRISPYTAVAADLGPEVDAFVQREDVRAALQARGVSPEAATERVRALSQNMVAQRAAHIDQVSPLVRSCWAFLGCCLWSS